MKSELLEGGCKRDVGRRLTNTVVLLFKFFNLITGVNATACRSRSTAEACWE